MTTSYQKFYCHWRGSPPYRDHQYSDRFLDKLPYKLPLGKNERGKCLLPFRSRSLSGDEIVVTESYVHMLHRILVLRDWDNGDNRGAVVTGQPGTGVLL